MRTPMSRALFCLGLGLSLVAPAAAQQTGTASEPVQIGVLTDMTGAFSDISGPGSAMAVRMAVEDFGSSVLGRPVELLTADHQNKPDLGSSIAREWFDRQGVVMIADLGKATEDDMPAEIDFSGGARGKFYRANVQLNVPVYLDADVQAYLAAIASKKGMPLSELQRIPVILKHSLHA